jgi:hypothetical protein
MTRAEVITLANQIARESRYGGAPFLTVYSSVHELNRWLEWCDPNGCYTADLAAAEGLHPYTLEEAWEAIEEMVFDA